MSAWFSEWVDSLGMAHTVGTVLVVLLLLLFALRWLRRANQRRHNPDGIRFANDVTRSRWGGRRKD
jgi:hypothetical protein